MKDKTPFKFENMWLKVEGFKELVRNQWEGYSVKGSFCHILAVKLKALKQDLTFWNRVVFGNVSTKKLSAMVQVGYWDSKERERVLLKEEKKVRRGGWCGDAPSRESSLDLYSIMSSKDAQVVDVQEDGRWCPILLDSCMIRCQRKQMYFLGDCMITPLVWALRILQCGWVHIMVTSCRMRRKLYSLHFENPIDYKGSYIRNMTTDCQQNLLDSSS